MNFLKLIRPEIIMKEFIILRHQVLQDLFRCTLVQGLLSQEMKIKLRAEFQCRHLQEGRSWAAKTANIGTSIRQIPYTFYILCCVNSVN